MNVEERALKYLERNGAMSVQELHDALSAHHSLTKAQVTDMVWRLAKQDQVNLEDVPPVTRSLVEFLRLWERNLWLYASWVLSVATVLAVYAIPDTYPWVVVRWVLGLQFVLFIPGYVTTQTLFPRGRNLNPIERCGLSVGLSIVEVPLVAFMLNLTPWEVRLTPIVISLSILTVGLSLIVLAREYKFA